MRIRLRSTMIVSRSCTMHSQSPPLIIGRTVLKESDEIYILGVKFDSKTTFEKHLNSVSEQLLRVFHDRSPHVRCFRGFVLPIWSTVLQYDARLPNSYLKRLDRVVSGACFLTGGVFKYNIVHRRSVAVFCMLYKIRCDMMHCTFYHCLVSQCGLQAVLWLHIGILILMCSVPRSTTGHLFPSQYLCGTILLTLYSTVGTGGL